MKIGTHITHPAADAFPLMDDESLKHLAADIKADGLMRPIVLLADDKHPDGRILDGRNRYHACLLAGVEPRFRMYDGDTDANSLALYVARENLRRRNLSPVQAALCTRRLCKLIRERKIRERVQSTLPIEANHVAETVLGDGTPELIAAVECGDVPADLAVEMAKHEPAEQRAMLEKLAKPEMVKAKPVGDASVAIDLTGADLAALRALVFAGEASVHGIVKAGAALLRKLVPGV
jgi:ParB-like chromosome segregation protein Spo0J